MAKIESISPIVGSLLTGEDEGRSTGYGAYRSRGTSDWLVIYTIAGRGVLNHGANQELLLTGDLFIIQPGTAHDYGADPEHRHWHNIWAHFLLRNDMLHWLDWPVVSPGIVLMRIKRESRGLVLGQFREMDRFCRRGLGRSTELGLNALERALLLADGSNPRSAAPQQDRRIRRAVDHLLSHLNQPPSLAALADVAGLSRSQFAKLFHQQVGQPPGAFAEQHRLLRVKRLLAQTRNSLQEIADEVGFSSPFYLSLRFKHHFGMSPRSYRRTHVERK